jgi:hypothetical protein
MEMIEGQRDMEIVGEARGRFDLLLAVRDAHADAVILSAEDSDVPGLCSHLLGEYPGLTILTLGVKGGHAVVEQLCPSRREIVNPSREKVVTALRDAMAEPCAWIQRREREQPGPPSGAPEPTR